MRRVVIVGLLLGCVAGGSSVPAQEKEKEPIVGRYDWQNGNVVVIRADGTATSGDDQGSQDGKWVTNPYITSGYVLMWKGGYVESLKLTEKGSRLEGKGLTSDGKSYDVRGVRKE